MGAVSAEMVAMIRGNPQCGLCVTVNTPPILGIFAVIPIVVIKLVAVQVCHTPIVPVFGIGLSQEPESFGVIDDDVVVFPSTLVVHMTMPALLGQNTRNLVPMSLIGISPYQMCDRGVVIGFWMNQCALGERHGDDFVSVYFGFFFRLDKIHPRTATSTTNVKPFTADMNGVLRGGAVEKGSKCAVVLSCHAPIVLE